jgi:tetratricopeptide (TPR) repeat protein
MKPHARPISRPKRIFISSTDIDLHAHHTALLEAIARLDQQAIDMRFFGAQAERTATTASLDYVDQADIVILLIAWRYGTLDPNEGKSITHLEFERAVQRRLPLLVYLADPATQDVHGPYGNLFPLEQRNAATETHLLALREEVVREGRVVDFFTTPGDLALKAATALGKYLIDEAQEGRLSPRIPHNLPSRTPDFVGREHELIQLDAELHNRQSAIIATAIAGLGGVGKSALAAEVMHQMAGDPLAFPGGLTWVRCNDRVGWAGLGWIYEQLLLDWGVTLGPEELAQATNAAEEAQVRERALRTRLPATAPALVLLDNVEKDLPLGRLLETLAARTITALVTTRTLFALPSLTMHRLDVLLPEEAVTLLQERYTAKGGVWDTAGDRLHGLQVVAALGHLPLAIDLAAARAARQNTHITTLERELQEPGTLEKLRDPADPAAGVRYILGRSLDVLDAPQRACFAALGMLIALDFPQQVALALFAAVLASEDQSAPAETLDLFITLSLVTPGETDGIQRLRLHPLLHELATEEWQRVSAPTQSEALAGLLAGIAAYSEIHEKHFALLARDEALIIEALQVGERQGGDRDVLIDITWSIDDYLDLQGRWQIYDQTMHLRLRAYQQQGDRAGEGQTLGNLGILAKNQGRYADAARYFEEALAIARELGDRAGEGQTLNNLGNLAYVQGRYADAIRYYEESLAIKRDIGDRAGEGATLGNLGNLARNQGRYADAARYYEESLAIARELGDRAGEGQTLNNLGLLAADQGRYADATRYYEESLAIARELGDRAGEGKTLGNLGSLADDQGRYADAARYYEQDLAIARELGDRAGEGQTLNNLGILAREQGHYADAARYYEESLAIARELGDRVTEGHALGNLGVLAAAQGRSADAARYYKEALAILRPMGDASAETFQRNLDSLRKEQATKRFRWPWARRK